jgi:alkylation response protein AidB-like acyl-CoA dehydrogenase
MAQFKWDSKDIEFNLFDCLQTQNLPFGLTREDQLNIFQEFATFVQREIFPLRSTSDASGAKWTPEGVKTPQGFIESTRKFYDNGWFSLGFHESAGGTPVPRALSIACSSIATGANISWYLYPMLARGAANVIHLVGSSEQKNTYLEPMVTGRFGGTMCLTEPGAGSDVGNLRSTATPLGGDRYSIQGTKIFITSGDNDIYENIVHLVLARTPGAPAGTKGLSLFIVPKFKMDSQRKITGSNDVVCAKIEEKMGLHGSATCELVFGKNGNCEGWLIGKEFDGMKNMFIMMNEARLDCGVQGEAQTNLAYEMTLQYTKEREQFGKVILEHPDVCKTMLKMRAMGRGMRALCLYTANLFDTTQEDSEIGLLTPICKAYTTDQAMLQTSEAVQMHGGYGFCSEYGIEQFMRDTKISAIYEGTNGIQSVDFVTRKILKDGGATLKKLQGKIGATLQEAQTKKLFSEELKTFSDASRIFQNGLQQLAQWGAQSETSKVLLHTTELLRLAGHIVVSWRLLDHALLAQDKLSQTSQSSQLAFYQSKIIDFQVFVAYFLPDAYAIEKTLQMGSSFSPLVGTTW